MALYNKKEQKRNRRSLLLFLVFGNTMLGLIPYTVAQSGSFIFKFVLFHPAQNKLLVILLFVISILVIVVNCFPFFNFFIAQQFQNVENRVSFLFPK